MKKPGKGLLRNMKFGSFLLALVLLFAVSIGAGFFFFRGKFAFDSSFIADIEARKDKQKVTEEPKKDAHRLYGNGGQETGVQDGAFMRQDILLVKAEDIIRRYVEPYKVRLIDLYLDNEGVIYVDFGDEIKRNISGGAIDELNLIAGLYKGIKSAVPGLTAMKILIEGAEAESLGGHIDISKPIGGEVAEGI